MPNSAPDALGVAAAALFGLDAGAPARAGAAALPASPGRDAAEAGRDPPGPALPRDEPAYRADPGAERRSRCR